MRSLRSRLILGSALIAVVPLAVAMVLLARRIETTVRAQSAARLSAALGGLREELAGDGERIAEKLRILGRDPLLKRLYLVRPAGTRDLSEYLAERRFLLGLDFLYVADTGGVVVADGTTAAVPPGEPDARRLEASARRGPAGLAIESLEGVPALAMTASAPVRYENALAGVLRGGRILDAGFLAQLGQTSGVELLLRDSGGHVVATTRAGVAGAQAAAAVAPGVRASPGRDARRVVLAGATYLGTTLPLEIGAEPHAAITGFVSTAAADQTIAALQVTSALLGVVGLGIAILLGVLWSSQISRPVERLAAYSRTVARGEWDQPLSLRSVRELETLVSALDRMRENLRTYRDRLVTSERHAAWSQMARKVAHEIKNPLTPIAVSVADLKRSFEQGRPEFPAILDQAARTVAEEVEALKRLLQEFSDFARLPAPEPAPCRLSALLGDLEALYGREVAEGRLEFARPDREIVFTADAAQIKRALVNLIKNGVEALDGRGRVRVSARVERERLEIAVSDTGPGLSEEQRANLFVPGFTTKAHGSGLGLTIVERIVNDHRGAIAVEAGAGRGTTFRIQLPLEGAAAAGG